MSFLCKRPEQTGSPQLVVFFNLLILAMKPFVLLFSDFKSQLDILPVLEEYMFDELFIGAQKWHVSWKNKRKGGKSKLLFQSSVTQRMTGLTELVSLHAARGPSLTWNHRMSSTGPYVL